jgi:hypothetical protein
MIEIATFSITLPALSPSQAMILSEGLFALAHELECRYGDDIRSQQQATRNQQEKNNHADTDDRSRFK